MTDDSNKEIIRREVRVERGVWNQVKSEAYIKGKNVLEHAGEILKKHASRSAKKKVG